MFRFCKTPPPPPPKKKKNLIIKPSYSAVMTDQLYSCCFYLPLTHQRLARNSAINKIRHVGEQENSQKWHKIHSLSYNSVCVCVCGTFQKQLEFHYCKGFWILLSLSLSLSLSTEFPVHFLYSQNF